MSAPDPNTAQTVLAEDPPGARTYPPEPVAKAPQGPRSPGQSEPGDMGAFEAQTDAAPGAENPAGDGGTGYRGG
ncbi:hypothetical protein SAMN05216360_13713 [Methylobacterium phyllostachyos]|uniref:Uncharacterized protein n=1 Tax=Methylobacterium phyllostachyos TaxID=582672 RepID=A0A1H0LKW9_9HYPH|nr:hypothetical protein [Methylobacterium phyllostachyos]SDO68859.1 hypothetical protein SAMN05216360_13713 [Methylobacterium phyllostachyos]